LSYTGFLKFSHQLRASSAHTLPQHLLCSSWVGDSSGPHHVR